MVAAEGLGEAGGVAGEPGVGAGRPAQEALEAEDIPQTLPRTFGEVKIPGYGWHPCILNDKGVPSHFYSDDDGWQECPKATFEEMK